MFKQTIIQLISNYSKDDSTAIYLWSQAEQHYTEQHRYYHTLLHLKNIYKELLPMQTLARDWDCILFSVLYHDIIYNPTAKDNEEKSAEFARQSLDSISFPKNRIDKCMAQIQATKAHEKSADADTNYLTDADLSILGQEWTVYEGYMTNTRKEYSFYNNDLYNAGRKRILEHFLKMPQIYKTSYFFDKYEEVARSNISKEIAMLNE